MWDGHVEREVTDLHGTAVRVVRAGGADGDQRDRGERSDGGDTGDVREEAGWRGAPGDRVFVVRHLPPAPRVGVVVCSPVGGEGDSNYRREVLLARALAHRGAAVQRSHWRGTGNSDGEPDVLAFDSMVEDAVQAVDDVAALVDGPVIVLGTRLSAFVAAEAVARTASAGLALWHPPASGDAYFRELGRLLRVNKLAQAAGGAVDAPRSLLQEIEADGVSEIGGYQIHRGYHASMAGQALADVRPPAGTRVLLVQFGGSSLPTAVQTPVDGWAAAGCEVATHVLADSETWWFAPDDSAEDQRPVTVDAVATTVEWMTASVGKPSVGAASVGAPPVGAPPVATPEVAR